MPRAKVVWHAKEPSLLNGHERRAMVKICSPSPVMVTYPYESKILKWDGKPNTNNKKTPTYFLEKINLPFMLF